MLVTVVVGSGGVSFTQDEKNKRHNVKGKKQEVYF
jgi:hypothetical protein